MYLEVTPYQYPRMGVKFLGRMIPLSLSSHLSVCKVMGSQSKRKSGRGQSFSTALDLCGQFVLPEPDTVVALETGAAANLACFK